ncbi:manganese-dependent inorganic pyrophosphatase [Phocicoccus pinnipedialis]|uniref:Probable manganese-dependent inorganic pyrophosphatase n=1 Tax=Phocicoccus pinnipedialis TaxID=110845 RepID=A0A6V7R984_9BACL|nr:manganese-dependent inorganic pyrophosphatase [Jeotgalicoccus pinnipedialis]MBP1940201.1 manganese-dependent inorganic pyrophosphatase [Jeotgalicoccus pinnipedialis]CAD2073989.1 putative manganese-dependent inorganic pyrophosphatase [Jeotgalicoccus pinnipedialis]
MSIKIFGHQNPDTDSITSAIVLAELESKLGNDATAYRLGEINPETAYALNYFNIDAPELLDSVIEEDTVMLVDHNEFQQSAPGIESATILAVIDHHRVANFETNVPLYFRAEPVGCTATVLYKIFSENNIEVSRECAGLMMSAIISDTLLLKSPTTTEQDEKTLYLLSEIADVNLEVYGLEMLKAGASTKDKTAEALINGDAKTFEMDNRSVRIAQVNVVDVDELFERKDELIEAINKEIDANEYDLFTLVVTNILESDSKVLALGEHHGVIEKAFDVSLEDNMALLEGVVSRKKQVVPNIEKAFASLYE